MAFKIDIRNQQKTPREKVVLIGTGKGTIHIAPQSTLQALEAGKDWVLKDARLNISVAPKQVVYLNITSVTAPHGYKFGVKLKFEGNPYEKILGYNQEESLLTLTVLHDGSIDAEIEEQRVWSFTPPPHASTFTLQVISQLVRDEPVLYEGVSAILPGNPTHSVNLTKGDLHAKHAEVKDWVLSEANLTISITEKHQIPLKITSLPSQQKGYLSAVKLEYGSETQTLNYNGEASLIRLRILSNGSVEASSNQGIQQVTLNCPPHPSSFSLNVYNDQENRPEIGYIPYRNKEGAMSTSILPGNCFFNQFPEAVLWSLNRAELAISVATRQLIYLNIEAVSGEETGTNKKSGIKIEYGNEVRHLAYEIDNSLLTLWVKTNGDIIAKISNQSITLKCPPHPSNFLLQVNNELDNEQPIKSVNKTIAGKTFTQEILKEALPNTEGTSKDLESSGIAADDTGEVVTQEPAVITQSLQNTALTSSTLEIPLEGYTAHFRMTSVSGLSTGAQTTAGIRLEYGGWSEYLGFNDEGSTLNITVEPDGTIWAEIGGKGVEFRPSNQSPEILRVPEDFRNIQAAIDEAHEDSVILLAPGVYKENLDFTDKNVLVASLAYLTGQSKYIEQTVLKPTDSIVFSQNDHRNTGLYGLTLIQTNDDLVITYRDSIPSFQNCVFVLQNIGRAALVARNNSVPLFRNCTIAGGNYAFVISSGANVMVDNAIVQSEYLVRTHNVQEMHRVMAVYSTLFLENDRNNKQFINYNAVGFKTNSSSKPIFINPQNNNYRLRDTSSAKRTGRDKSEAGAYNILPTMKFQEIFRDIHDALKNPLFVYDNEQLWIQWQASAFVQNYEISIKDLHGQLVGVGSDHATEYTSAGTQYFVQETVEGTNEFVFNQTLETNNIYEVTITPQMSEEIMPLAKTFHIQLEAAPELSPSLIYFAQNNLIKAYWEKPAIPGGNLVLLLKKEEQLLALERDLAGSDFSWSENISKDELYEALFVSQQSVIDTDAYDEGDIVHVNISPAIKTSVTPLNIASPELNLEYEEGNIKASWNNIGENFTYDFKCWENNRQNHPIYTNRTTQNNIEINETPEVVASQNGVHQLSTSDRVWRFPLKHKPIERGKEYIGQVRAIDKEQGYIGAWSEPQNVFALISDDLPAPEPSVKYTEGHLQLRWQGIRHAQGYDIDVTDTSTGDLVYQKTRFMQTFLFIHDNVEKGKNYEIKVRAVSMRVLGKWSAPIQVFTLDESDLAAPELLLNYTSEGIAANWQPIAFAQSYELVVKNDSEQPDTVSNAIVTETKTNLSSGIEAHQKYLIKVRAVFADIKGAWSNIAPVLTVDESDLTPPENIVLGYENEAIKVSWDKVAYAEKYEITVREKESDHTIGANLTVDTVSVDKNSGIEKGKTYLVQTRSLAAGKNGEWSNPQEILTLLPNDLETPQITLTNPNGHIEVNWEPTEFAESYEVSIKDGTTGETVEENKEVTHNTCTFSDHIERDKIYEVQVRALAQGLQGEWSASRTIKVKQLEDKLAIVKQRLGEHKENKGFYVLDAYTLEGTGLHESLKDAFGIDEIILNTPKDLQEQGQQILLSGTTPSLFLMPKLNIQLILMNQGDEVETTINFQMPKDWRFTDSFASLENTWFKDMKLQEAQFTFSSISYLEASWQVPITPGLNFYAKASLNESLEVIQHLNGSQNSMLPVSGKVAVKNGLPDIQLRFVDSKFELNHEDKVLPVKALLHTLLPDNETVYDTDDLPAIDAEIYLHTEADFLAGVLLEARLSDPRVNKVTFVHKVVVPQGNTEFIEEEGFSSEDLRARGNVDGEDRIANRERNVEEETGSNNLEERESITENHSGDNLDILKEIAAVIGPMEEDSDTEEQSAISLLQKTITHLIKEWVDWETQGTSLLPEKYSHENIEEMPVQQISLHAILHTRSIASIDVQLGLSNWAALAPYYSINAPNWVVSVQYPFDETNRKVTSQVHGNISLSGVYVPFVAQAPDFNLISDCQIKHNLEASDLILDYSETSDVPLPGSLPNFGTTRLELRIEPLSGEFYVTAHSETPWEIEVTHEKNIELQNVGLTINRENTGDELKVVMNFFGYIKEDDTLIRLIASRKEGNWAFGIDTNFEHQLPPLSQLISYFDDAWKNEMPQSLSSLSDELLLNKLDINLGLDKSFDLLITSKPGWATHEFLPTVVSFGLQNFELGISKQGSEAISGHLSGEFDLGKKIFFPLIFALPFDEQNYLFSLVHFNEDLATPQLGDLLALANPDWEDKLPLALQNMDAASDLEIQNFQLLYLEDSGDIPEKTFIMEMGTNQFWDGWQLVQDSDIKIDNIGLRIFRTTNDLHSDFDLRLFGNLPIGNGAVSLQIPVPYNADIHQITMESVLEQPRIQDIMNLAAPELVTLLPTEITGLDDDIVLKDVRSGQENGEMFLNITIANTEGWEGWQLATEPIALHLPAFELQLEITPTDVQAKITAPVEIFGEQATLEFNLSPDEPNQTATLLVSQEQNAALGDILDKLFEEVQVPDVLKTQPIRNFKIQYAFAEKALLLTGNCGDIALEGIGLYEDTLLKARLTTDEQPSLSLQGKLYNYAYETYYPFRFLLPHAGQGEGLTLPFIGIVDDDHYPEEHRMDGIQAAQNLSKINAQVTAIAFMLKRAPYQKTAAETAKILKEQTRFTDIPSLQKGIVAAYPEYKEVNLLLDLLTSLQSDEGEVYFTSEEIMEALLNDSDDMDAGQLAKMLKTYKDDPIEVAGILKESLGKTFIGSDPSFTAGGMVKAMNEAGYELPAITAALSINFSEIPQNEQVDFYVRSLKNAYGIEQMAKSVYQLSQRKLTCDSLAVAMQKANYELVDIAQGIKHAFDSSVLAEHLPSKVVKALKTLKEDFITISTILPRTFDNFEASHLASALKMNYFNAQDTTLAIKYLWTTIETKELVDSLKNARYSLSAILLSLLDLGEVTGKLQQAQSSHRDVADALRTLGVSANKVGLTLTEFFPEITSAEELINVLQQGGFTTPQAEGAIELLEKLGKISE